MTVNRDGQAPDEYQGVNPVNRPKNIIAQRAPLTSDRRYPISTLWVNRSANTVYALTNVAAGSATWALASPGASDVDTLTGDGGGAISPAAGDIILAGGTNITTAGAGSTITFNMDAAITLATSVTAPLYTSAGAMVITPAAANDLDIRAVAGQDIIMKLGDAAGANKLSVTDSADVEVFAVDSNGGQTYTTITASGLITGNASATILTAGTALTLAADNSGDAVILGGGTVARAITIGQDAAAHTVAIGQAAAGAITVDTAAGVSIDSATASNFTVTGAADLTLASSAGSVIVNGEEAVADAVQIQSAAGGIDVDGALQVNIASSQAAADAVRIDASNAAGGIDIDDGGGGIAMDSAAGISLDAAAVSNFSVSGAGIDLNLESAAGRVVINGEEAATNAITLLSAAGGIDVNAALEINIDSSEAAVADAVRIVASAADGGIDIDAGTGGIAIDTTGAMSLNGAAASDFTVTGAFDLTLASSAGSVVVNAAEAVPDAILLNASNAAGGITLQTGGGDITISATVKELNSEFAQASGDDIIFQESPICMLSGNAPALPTGATGTVNLLGFRDLQMEQFILGAGQTIIAPVMDATGLLVSGDLTATEGFEYNWGAALNNSRHAFTIGTSAAFFIEMKYTVADVSGAAPYMVGFRKVEANNATLTSYTDYAMIGLDAVAAVGTAVIKTELNSGGTTNTDTTDAWTDGQSHTVKVLVSAAGVVTYEFDGGAPSVTAAFTFDNADVVVPFFRLEHQAGAPGAVHWETLKVGFQA